MTTWRYYTTSLLDDVELEELPLAGVKFNFELNKATSFTADLPMNVSYQSSLGTFAKKNALYKAATLPGATAIWAERDGVLMWGGVLWDRKFKKSTGKLSITCGSFESFVAHRYLAVDKFYTSTDQLTIARNLIETMQADSPTRYSSLGITTSTTATSLNTTSSGVLRDRNYFRTEYGNYFDRISQLANVIDGFDFAIDVSYVPGTKTRVKAFNVAYPRRGRTYVNNGIRFDNLNIIDYDFSEQGSRIRNRVWTIGNGDSAGKLVGVSSLLASTQYPWLEYVQSETNVSNELLLQKKSEAVTAAYNVPPVQFTLDVRTDVFPELGDWVIGDDCFVSLPADDFFPTGMEGLFRIVRADIRPNDDDTPESATLTLMGII